MSQNLHAVSSPSKTECNFYQRLSGSIEFPKWIGKFYAVMTAFYGSNWTDKFQDEFSGKILMQSWFLALKNYSEEFIINAAMVYHHQNQYAPSSPAQLLGTMKPRFDAEKKARETQELLANMTKQEIITAEEIDQHKQTMAQLDKMRELCGLERFDDSNSPHMNEKGKHYLNLMYEASGKPHKYLVEGT